MAAAADLFGKGSVLLTGDQASETALKAEPLNEFRIIHLAAHGVSDQMEPDRAGLVLAPGSGSEDGFWQAREIRRSHLSADLVTLSACETGTGRLQGEEGVMNLWHEVFWLLERRAWLRVFGTPMIVRQRR